MSPERSTDAPPHGGDEGQPDDPDPLPPPGGADDLGETFADVRRYQAGEPAALNRLFARYYPRVLSYVRIRLGPALRARVEVEDVVQDTFVTALGRMLDFEMHEPGAFIHWLGKLAENQIRDQLRYWGAEKRDAGRERGRGGSGRAGASTWSSVALAASSTPPPEKAIGAEEREVLEACIERLPFDQKEVVLLRMVAGLSLEYAARELGRSPQATAMLHSRAKLKLMECVQRRVTPD